jgi:Carboxypeptidase regulatory-like domain
MLRNWGSRRGILALSGAIAVLFLVAPSRLKAQANGMIEGTVTDPSKAAVPGAKVRIENPVSQHVQEVQTGTDGHFQIPNVPFNPYHLTVTASGFANFTQDVDVRSTVPVTLDIALMIGGATTNITVTENAIDLIEQDSTDHTDVDRGLFDKLPLESPSSSVSSLVTLASPGVAADSNGLFHGMGDHAESSFSVDGQPITDQQSKVFSNQIPIDSIQSLEVIDGAPPAEYGDKTSLIINVTTRSGLGVTQPKGDVYTSYGSFGTATTGFDVGYGGPKWGNFISASGLNTSRFLDPPEFQVFHDKGNEENVFDRVDFKPSSADNLQLNLEYTRSWFQNPNSYDQEYHANPVLGLPFVLDNPITGAPLGPSDQRSQIKTFNIAPTWTRLIGSDSVFTLGGFVREDQYNYYPSGDPFNDFSPDLQAETFGQSRSLKNAGIRAEVSHVRGIHNFKAGVLLEHWFLTEDDSLGIVDPGFLTSLGCPNPTIPACGVLAPYDLTTGGSLFNFRGHADIREEALYAQDTITKGNWTFNLGLRGDFYDGLSKANQAEPRLGVAYKISPSSTVLRVSYARTQETPFNENLIIGSTGCQNPVIADIVPPAGVACVGGPITPGWRNEFHAGLEQAFGKYLVMDGQYIWKYTHNAYDFGVVGNTPLAFPIEWQKSKITGFTYRLSVPNYRGLTAEVVMSSVAARFFLPQVGGVPIVPPATGVFRIDHDEAFNQTTHAQYQPRPNLPWVAFSWKYDSGFVSGAVPCLAATATCAFSTSVADGGANATIASGQVALVNNVTGEPLTADQEYQAGLTCDGKPAAPSPTGPALAVCDAAGLGSTLLKIPAPGTENDDHNPQRIAPRSLFDGSIGDDNLFRADHYKWSLRFTVINMTNKVALYNFLSTFSGTHYLTPRTETVELGFHF